MCVELNIQLQTAEVAVGGSSGRHVHEHVGMAEQIKFPRKEPFWHGGDQENTTNENEEQMSLPVVHCFVVFLAKQDPNPAAQRRAHKQNGVHTESNAALEYEIARLWELVRAGSAKKTKSDHGG